jgi:tRNA(Ile2) C34 agmatinyltransferase TiaS
MNVFDEMPACALCGGPAEELAKFGTAWWFRCRSCGASYSTTIAALEAPGLEPAPIPRAQDLHPSSAT